jgi:hypothetical protein
MMSEVSPNSLIVASPRRRGRPRVDEPQERLSTRLPLPVYDRLVKQAHQQDKKLAALVRDVLRTYARQFPS